MGKLLILIDNSNIFVSGKNLWDKNLRFSYDKFEKICAGDDTIVEKHIAGSAINTNNAFWERMKQKGYKVHTYECTRVGEGRRKEKSVDMALGIQGAMAIERIRPDRVVLLTGDQDFVPIAQLKNSNDYPFILDVWAFSDALSFELERASDNAYRIDDYKSRLLYFQYEDKTTESFNRRNERKAAEEKASREELRIAQEKAEKEEKAASNKFWKRARAGIAGAGAAIAGIFHNKKKDG